MLILTRLVAGFGTEALAGYGIGARLEFLLVPIAFAVGVASVPMVGMAMGAGDIERARRVAWTAAGVAAAMLGAIGLVVTIAPDLWSGVFTSDRAVRAIANQYLRSAGPGFLFVGLGLGLYFASQGSGKVLAPVLARDRPALGRRSRRLVADGERCAGVESVRARWSFHDGLRVVHRRCGLPDAVGYPLEADADRAADGPAGRGQQMHVIDRSPVSLLASPGRAPALIKRRYQHACRSAHSFRQPRRRS